ncbi:hypothetical protein [Leptospira weilii]|uniref:hypothetical protein n=1 Tax=Leptospira weilii TaxID=28184 RepID=UPI00056A3744|nr:hypothetical protein [Leptospira weilii]
MDIQQQSKTILFLLGCCFCSFYYPSAPIFAEDVDKERLKCPPMDRQSLILDLNVSDKGNHLNLLLSQLRNEKIQIIDVEKSSKKRAQVRIEILESAFRPLFSGSLEYKLVEYSSHSGTYCQRYIRNYTIPLRYKKFIREIQIPDPQVE